ncbi:MAG: cation-translocating P-type ATPase [Ruminococcaceae bacterium]|nr:cation-translocating P-type ATPase [Oscillospiraceae bacterium]
MKYKYSGLTAEEVSERVKDGRSNGSLDIRTKSVPSILRDNIFTLFNLINTVLAALVALVGSWRNMLFMGVVASNIAIGIFQEIRSKRVIDRLSIISAPKAHLIRDGEEKILPVSDIVTDDIMLLASGRQVCADCIVLDGECEADESLITGESDPVPKNRGGELLSGSFIVSGSCTARVTGVGAESVSGRITSGAKYIKKNSSEMMRSINKIIRTVSVCIVPFGLILFCKAFFVTSIEEGVTSTVAALIGMIPEGLVLLTSIALAVSTIRLGRRQTLCQDLYCVESLARVDVLCLDKTGTLTEGCMEVREVCRLDDGFDVDGALNAFSSAFPEPNATLKAIRERWSGSEVKKTAVKKIPFSSARKWSAAQFDDLGTIALGAPSFVLGSDYAQISDICEEYAEKGFRVLVLAHSPLPLGDNGLPSDISAKALLVLSDKIRKSAPDTLEYFVQQGVALKVISGDDPLTVSSAAKRAGLENADNYVDMGNIEDEKIPEIAEKYTVFGRVTPNQKLLLVKALKTRHKVAMTGDGVNDVLALKEADCSIAMQSGSDAARAASQLVLLNSDFSSLPLVVEEGRRCINNIQRSAALFLVKTVFSFLLAAFFLILPYGYPFKPIQMTLISALAIGAPSFLLALEPNKSLVRGNFLANVMKKAAPAGISVAVGICLLTAAESVFSFAPEDISAMAVYLTGFACFLALADVCRPFKVWRAAMLAALIAAFIGAVLLFPGVFYIVPLDFTELTVLGVLAVIVLTIQFVLGLAARTKK